LSEKEGLGERIEKKAEEMKELNKQVWSQATPDNIAWGRLIRGLIVAVIIALVIIYRGPITSSLATEMRQGAGALGSQSQALIVANYLLGLLILATIGVEFILPFKRWWNRPKLRLHSFSYAMNSLTLKPDEGDAVIGARPSRKIRIVYLNLWNDGNDAANEPIVFVNTYQKKLSKLIPTFDTDLATIDKSITIIRANTYAKTNDDDLAVEFMRKGLKKVEYLAGHHEGKRFVLGFSFEEGKHFYFASEEGARPTRQKFQKDPIYACFVARARNAKKKQLKLWVRMDIQSWDTVKLDYREWPIPEEPED